jgi:arsenite/tail-anchored protein-transporting ATPase
VRAARDALAAAIYRREQAALAETPAVLRDLPTTEVPLKPFNLVGIDALRQLFRDAAGRDRRSPQPPAEPLDARRCGAGRRDRRDGHGLVMVMGKGGVGKTTLAAAMAVELATGACRCT